LSPFGDSSDWFSLDEASATEIVRTFDPEIEDPSCLLRHATAPGHPALYWRQRSLIEQLRAGPVADNLRVEEEIVWIFSAVVKRAYDARGSSTATAPAPDHDAVSRTKAVLARRYREAMGLSELASEVGSSMYHLSRIFRRQTGVPLHAWRMCLRLNEALNRLCEATATDLSALSLELGFSSHSHFTAAFRRAFGVPPSAVRKQLDKLRVVDMASRQRSI
jgi:AraC-like DNA-binding protein